MMVVRILWEDDDWVRFPAARMLNKYGSPYHPIGRHVG